MTMCMHRILITALLLTASPAFAEPVSRLDEFPVDYGTSVQEAPAAQAPYNEAEYPQETDEYAVTAEEEQETDHSSQLTSMNF